MGYVIHGIFFRTAFCDMGQPSLDDIKKAVVTGIFSDSMLMERLTLKGGTALEFLYKITTRASIDVDLSMEGEFDSAELLEARLREAVSRALNDIGLTIIDFKFKERPSQVSEDLKAFWGGYLTTFKVISQDVLLSQAEAQLRQLALPVTRSRGKTFQIEISRFEAVVERKEFDLDGYLIYGYTPEMLVAEKMRALCQQTVEYNQLVKRNRAPEDAQRGRDCLDIYSLCEIEKVDVRSTSFQRTFQAVFLAKRVELELLEKIDRYREFHRIDFAKLKDTLRDGVILKEFDFYFDYVLGLRDALRPLWIK
jgi:predicted nucleotidyltransferase component of viral defense system